jgi:hypothetical protein
MTRLLSVTVLLAVLASGRLARAQTDSGSGTTGSGLPNGATIEFQHLKVFKLDKNDQTGEFVETESTSDQRLQSFSLASCNCARADLNGHNPPDEHNPLSAGWFQYLLVESASSGVRFGVDFFTGTDCTDDTNRPLQCSSLIKSGIQDVDQQLLTAGGTYQSFNLYDVVNGDPRFFNKVPCQQLESTQPIYTFVSTTGSQTTFDYQVTQNAGTLSTDSTSSTSTGVDTLPPKVPSSGTVKANPSDQTINLTWDAQTIRSTDIAYFQALCSDTDGNVVRGRAAGRRYVTTRQLCPATVDSLADDDLAAESFENSDSEFDLNNQDHVITVANPGPDDVEVNPPSPGSQFGQLNESYICASTQSGTATSLSITGLQNNHHYRIILLTVDLHGNYAVQYFDHTITPIPVTDFWEDLHDRGSETQGGLCLLNETYGDDNDLTNTLRAFRDDTLAASAPGRALVRAYYATLGRLGGLVHGSLALRVVAGVVLAPIVALGLAWHWLTLPGVFALLVLGRLAWRRRRALARVAPAWLTVRRASTAAALSVALLVPGLARADKFQPYWETDPLDKSTDSNGVQTNDPDYDPQFDPALNALPQNNDDMRKAAEENAGPAETKWILGVRAGPYTPDIDKQLGGTGRGPYRQMFGGYAIVPMVDFDRVLWSGFGQVTAGVSVGFLRRSADAFAIDSSPTDAHRTRVPGATNTFTLIPFALLAGYRFTWLDENYSIPVVPYVRGGIAYYPWWVSAPAGGFAEICDSNGANCGNRALGASLGVQGSFGISIRAESISASTAQSIRQSGFQHIGIYGELSIAKVDGFGSDKKLSVGDRTWFGGINFEF